ncbi:hypothetical protein AB1Y20_015897 [Prymnesium parvum]|uniref:Uncharacterized protein n=1 Tax=Prymnesium parvum TaxID=97485 RepID=A0AB34JY20_PRYPA
MMRGTSPRRPLGPPVPEPSPTAGATPHRPLVHPVASSSVSAWLPLAPHDRPPPLPVAERREPRPSSPARSTPREQRPSLPRSTPREQPPRSTPREQRVPALPRSTPREQPPPAPRPAPRLDVPVGRTVSRWISLALATGGGAEGELSPDDREAAASAASGGELSSEEEAALSPSSTVLEGSAQLGSVKV